MNQPETRSAKRNRSEERQGVMKTIQKQKLEIELPENAYNVLREMAVIANQSTEQYAKEMIYAMMECDLTGGGEMGSEISKYLFRKYNYDPNAWREETS